MLSALIAPDAMRTGGMGRHRGGYPGGGGGGGLGGVIFGSPRGQGRSPYPGGGQIGTHSAGTEEIARESGGDSMRVDDAYALQDTLARIRQRYAVHFSLPAGVRAGEEREIDLELTDAARSRYPGAEVRYRRSYYAPDGVSSPSSEPVVVSRSGSDGASPATDDPNRPRLRRAGVSQVPDRSREGPLSADGPSNPAPAAPSEEVWRKADPAQSAPPDPNAPGWRKARPDDVQPPPPPK